MTLRRSTENESAMVATNGWPFAAQTMASAMPVLPEVASMTVWPGFSVPLRSASLMMAKASRSFTEAIGLNDSTLTYISTWSGPMRFSRMTGVLPIVSRILL